jgi:hypothetical protein
MVLTIGIGLVLNSALVNDDDPDNDDVEEGPAVIIGKLLNPSKRLNADNDSDDVNVGNEVFFKDDDVLFVDDDMDWFVVGVLFILLLALM